METTDAEFIEIVKQASSICSVLGFLHKARVGTNYKMVRDRLANLGLMPDWVKRDTIPDIPLEERLCENSTYSRKQLKKRLIASGILKNVCAECGQLPEWNGKPLVLRLDHINGVNDDNRIENLRILCPHCDSQTSTFCGRNKKTVERVQHHCECGAPIYACSKRCRSCQNRRRHQPTKINWPSTPELLRMIEDTNYVQCGKTLGVSDNAVRKHLKSVTSTPHQFAAQPA